MDKRKFDSVMNYLINHKSNLDLDKRLLLILMEQPNITYQTIEIYFDRDPDYRKTFNEVYNLV